MIAEDTRIRVVRALTGLTPGEFAARLGVTRQTVTTWERGRSCPGRTHRMQLQVLCEELKIGFTPSGMPVPFNDVLTLKPRGE